MAGRGRRAEQGRGGKAPEIKVSGRHACRALYERRPETLIRVYISDDALSEFSDVLKFCAENKLAYHVVEDDELERVSASHHHEGVCMLAFREEVYMEDLLSSEAEYLSVIALDGVDNPHNMGAILRTAAHFGVHVAIVSGDGAMTPAAYRVAEGGASWVDVIRVQDMPRALRALQDVGFRVVGTGGTARRTIYEEQFAARNVLVMGSERHGVAPEVADVCDVGLRIPGTDAVESLNVSTATAVVLAEMWRQAM